MTLIPLRQNDVYTSPSSMSGTGHAQCGRVKILPRWAWPDVVVTCGHTTPIIGSHVTLEGT